MENGGGGARGGARRGAGAGKQPYILDMTRQWQADHERRKAYTTFF